MEKRESTAYREGNPKSCQLPKLRTKVGITIWFAAPGIGYYDKEERRMGY